jgi:IstB-like ATP binding protein
MERSQLFDLMGELKLYGMKAAFDEIMATAVKRQHEPQRIVGDLLNAEISEKRARSIKYQLTIAKLPLAKDPTSSSRARRSTRPLCTTSPVVASLPSSATSCWSGARGPERPT